jgi:DNA repair exonuclease SbcCD nuclease subunit
MIKLFETGDNHFGMKHSRYSQISSVLIESRYESLQRMVDYANSEHCDCFIVTGDLFDNTQVLKRTVERVVGILGKFESDVFVLPGNHDYYAEDVAVWHHFDSASASKTNIKLLSKNEPYETEYNGGRVVFYPAVCSTKHSDTNELDWIKYAEIDASVFNIGLAHGSFDKLSFDNEAKYFPMTFRELDEIKVDAWLIGHTHVQYPEINPDEVSRNVRIFNAGTHEQTDLANRTDGSGFLITIDNDKSVTAKRFISGKIRYYDITNVKVSDGNSLASVLEEELSDKSSDSIVRISLSGGIEKDEYNERNQLYEAWGKRLLFLEPPDDSGMYTKITAQQITSEFPEFSFPNQFLSALADDPGELQLAYDLVKELQKRGD